MIYIQTTPLIDILVHWVNLIYFTWKYYISQEFFYFLFQTQKTYSENCFEKPSLLPSKYGLSSFDTDGFSKEVYST